MRPYRGSRSDTLLLFMYRDSNFSKKLKGVMSKIRLLLRLTYMRVSSSAKGCKDMILFLESDNSSIFESWKTLKSSEDSKEFKLVSLRTKDRICVSRSPSCFQNNEFLRMNYLVSLNDGCYSGFFRAVFIVYFERFRRGSLGRSGRSPLDYFFSTGLIIIYI